MGKLNALDLFSGIGGITYGLQDYVRPIAYCEIERYAQGVLLSRMAEGQIPHAPIWNDVTTLNGTQFHGSVDIIYAGFPCQDISVAGNGRGLAGKRSGLFFEICRLAKEIEPTFLFLENVPAIRRRGLDAVIEELTALGYDCRWTMLSAFEVGAPHKRERWFLLANASGGRLKKPSEGKNQQSRGTKAICASFTPDTKREFLRNEQRRGSGKSRNGKAEFRDDGEEKLVADSACKRSDQGIAEFKRLEGKSESHQCSNQLANTHGLGSSLAQTEYGTLRNEIAEPLTRSWWTSEPGVGRVVNGHPFRVDRIKSLGNGVVPLQVKTAFEELMGFKNLQSSPQIAE